MKIATHTYFTKLEKRFFFLNKKKFTLVGQQFTILLFSKLKEKGKKLNKKNSKDCLELRACSEFGVKL
jgi:hypothetical protein